MKNAATKRGPTDMTQVEAFTMEEWTYISQEMYRKLVYTFKNCLETFIPDIGYAIDY